MVLSKQVSDNPKVPVIKSDAVIPEVTGQYVDPRLSSLPLLQIGTAIGPQTFREQLAKRWWELKLADFGMQIEKDGRRQLIIERLIKKTQDGTLGKITEESMDAILKDDPMGVHIGDHQHVYLPPQIPEPKGKSLLETLFPYALTAVAGAGIVWGLIKYVPTDTHVSVANPAVVPADVDRDWELRLSK